jgi:hypothetical protein
VSSYNTNLAAEFWVLSALHRLGVEALLTLGNKKSVDILVTSSSNEIRTLDVKGVAKQYDWPADNIRVLNDKEHFYVLLSFENNIANVLNPPSVWIVPATKLKPFIKSYRTRKVISRSWMKAKGSKYKNAWVLIIE